jgi:hypothetical protein
MCLTLNCALLWMGSMFQVAVVALTMGVFPAGVLAVLMGKTSCRTDDRCNDKDSKNLPPSAEIYGLSSAGVWAKRPEADLALEAQVVLQVSE